MFSRHNFSSVTRARFEGGFFGPILRDVREKMLPYQWQALNDRVQDSEPSGCIRNFEIAAGRKKGSHHGFVFQDSDLAKWLEAVAYQLQMSPDAALERLADEAIELVEQAQMPDGYLNTYYQLTDITKRYTNLRDDHELYTAGHMMEAATAYYLATGKDRLLKVMERMAENIMAHIGPQPGKLPGYPGHEEIELALCKMYDVTGKEEYLRLAEYFINQRGQAPNFFVAEQKKLGRDYKPGGAYGYTYAQHHLPVREQTTLEGHSVRALYLLSGMADVAMRTGDESLKAACETLYRNVTQKRMYVTGGVGSSRLGEAFTLDYDLPGDTAYAETCASIALIFFCRRMLEMSLQGDYADTMERALYNTCLAGMSLDMQRFFYVNPLSVDPQASRLDDRKRHALPERPKWFGCACCPPNLARLLSSLALYAYSATEEAVMVHLYLQGEADLQVGSQEARLSLVTDYPAEGKVLLRVTPGTYGLRLHLPAWCAKYTLLQNGKPLAHEVKDGYLHIPGPLHAGDIILDMDMPPYRVYANPAVREEIGKVALARGPMVFCLEEVDNGKGLHRLSLPRDAALAWSRDDSLPGGQKITARGARLTADTDALYAASPGSTQTAELTFIPYHAWANRGENEMTVWLREA
ncbi:MAG: glycoside hydrolase family 127 protein [Christensenellales bacterium]|jgi:DUF1680 family protein